MSSIRVYTGDAEEAAIKRAMRTSLSAPVDSPGASETYVLASSEKIGSASPFRVVDFSHVAAAITDAVGPTRLLRSIERAGLPIITAH